MNDDVQAMRELQRAVINSGLVDLLIGETVAIIYEPLPIPPQPSVNQ
jgi:hypothetical protein